jgi:hypothetical protein
MDEAVLQAVSRSQTIDITTRGRQTGLPRRIEIVSHNFEGRIFISGLPSPRRRSWIANLVSDPTFMFHLKGNALVADLPATARVIDDVVERRAIMPLIARAWNRTDIEAMVTASPLIEVTLVDVAAVPEPAR